MMMRTDPLAPVVPMMIMPAVLVATMVNSCDGAALIADRGFARNHAS
jgi:hypothetical protein